MAPTHLVPGERCEPPLEAAANVAHRRRVGSLALDVEEQTEVVAACPVDGIDDAGDAAAAGSLVAVADDRRLQQHRDAAAQDAEIRMRRDPLDVRMNCDVEVEPAVHSVEVELKPSGVELGVVAGGEPAAQLLAVPIGILGEPGFQQAADSVEDRVVDAIEEGQVRLLLARFRRVVARALREQRPASRRHWRRMLSQPHTAACA